MLKNAFVLFPLILSSCALTDIHIPHEYKAKSSKSIMKPYKVFIEVDNKESRVVGVKKGGHGNETAQVLLEKSQSEWVKLALEIELAAYGFTVINKPQKGAVRLKVFINQVFVEPGVQLTHANLVAISDLDVVATIPKGKKYRRNFVEYDSEGELVWTDSDFLERFHTATQNSFASIAKRLDELLRS